MRIEWMHRKGEGRVVVFFNGWGMDVQATCHLKTDCDVVMFYDYRSLQDAQLPDLSAYDEVYVVAWSMGVWAATCVVPLLRVNPVVLVAINGTEHPVDDCFGIPVSVYALTENGLNERGREKFFLRMFNGKAELERFPVNKPCRELAEQCDELRLIRQQSAEASTSLKWDKIYISEKDIIFPVENQINWWKGKGAITMLSSGHYPFYCFETWEEIVIT